MKIWEQLEKLDKDTDLGTTFYVNPTNDNVIVSHRTITSEWVVWDAGTIEWPEGLDYHHLFEPAQFLTPRNWEWHLSDFVEDGQPFLVQLQVLEAPFNEDGELEDTIIGWVMMVRVDK